ncbi:DNA topoisomerase, partial [Pseudomonas aeruginosa]
MRLFLCEKPSQGKDIGRILGATQRAEGCLNGSGVTVTWCIGHLVEAAAPEAYDEQLKRWSIEQLPIIPQHWRVEVKPKTATQFKVVKALLAKATQLVIATDADREGELIAREIIDLCGYRGPIERLWLSALNDASIRAALGKLRPSAETLPMYYSALARSRADWLVGMNLSRLFTVLGRQAGYDGVLSVGRVQTPTLKLVVDRDREIAAFVSVPYWAIDVSLSAGGQAFTAQWVPPNTCTDDAGRCLQQPIAQHAAQQIRAADSAQVVAVETERVREGPPLPFDLGTLQEVCSRQLGLDVQETLDIAQALYETHKATTYPRSDSGYLPESMFAEVPTVLDSLVKTDPLLRPIMDQL